MKNLFIIILLAAAFGAGFGYDRWYHLPHRHAEKTASGYHCPMHPQVKSDHAGDCPICGMKLVADSAAELPKQGQVLYYQDPQNPAYHSDKPGLNPETGNELKPVYAAESAGTVMIPAEKTAVDRPQNRRCRGSQLG